MPLITDPDLLNQGTEVDFDTSLKTITLNTAGNLSTDGVTLKALYSFSKEEWKDDPTLVGFVFPFVPITDESYELIDGWNLVDDTTKYLVRTAGWSVVDETTGNVSEIWSGIVGLGSIEPDDQLYFNQGVGATDFQLTGQVNQAVQVYADTNADGTPDFDYRSTFDLFVREQGQTFGKSALSDIGVTTLANQAYRFPISTGADLKISESDANISANAPYTGMSIRYYPSPQQRSIGGVDYDFGIIIDGNNGTAEEIYEFVQFQLRQNSDIDVDAGPDIIGSLSDELLEFVGDTLKTKFANNTDGGGGGVYIDNFQANDTNRIVFTDNTQTERTFPFVASLVINFNNNLQASSDAIYRVFFSDPTPGAGDEFDTSGAILVDDNDGIDMAGLVDSQPSISLTFDYDGNTQGGRTPGTDAAITVVAIGTDTAQHVLATGVIGRSTSNVISLVSPLERNYET